MRRPAIVRIAALAVAVLTALPGSAVAGRSKLASQRAALLTRHNRARAKANRPKLRMNAKLNAAAQRYAELLRRTGKFGHSVKGTLGSRIRAEDYRFRVAGENIAKGQRSPSAVVRAWMRSSGHRRNILNRKYCDVGFGVSGNVWVVDFGGR
jgi:uncharacterized protein YkwD